MPLLAAIISSPSSRGSALTGATLGSTSALRSFDRTVFVEPCLPDIALRIGTAHPAGGGEDIPNCYTLDVFRICKVSIRCQSISRSFLPPSNTRAIPQQLCSPEKIAPRSKNCIARLLQSLSPSARSRKMLLPTWPASFGESKI